MTISTDKEAEILRLYHAERWRIGTIARQLRLHHTTVRRVLNQAGIEKTVLAPRPSIEEPFIPLIVETLEKYPTLSAMRLFERAKERGYPGGPDHFRRVVSWHLLGKPAEAVRRPVTLVG